MDPKIKQMADRRLKNAYLEIVQRYTTTALLLNAADISKRRYEQIEDFDYLSTTLNIPPSLRMDLELDLALKKEDLVKDYGNSVVQTICNDFLVNTVSIFDGCLEDIYGDALTISSIPDVEVEKKVRSAWANDNLRTFFKNDLALKSPLGKTTTPEMAFDRYEECRIFRHCLIHSKGTLTAKQKARLNQFKSKLPVNLQAGSMASAPFLKGDNIQLAVGDILVLRKWILQQVLYFSECFSIS